LFLELGKALYVFQSIEVRLKYLLPHLNVPGTEGPPKGEGWGGRRKYLDSKEMLGNLVRILQERMQLEDPDFFEQEWRDVIQGRNDVVHNFLLQPFAGCNGQEEHERAIEYVRTRRLKALPLLHMLDCLLRGFVAVLQLPPNFEGEVTVDLPEWWPPNAA
jgi:hypothetical protein